MMQENRDIKGIHNHIKVLEKRYRKNLDSHLFFPLADAYVKADMLDQAEMILREGMSNHPKYCAAKALLGEIFFKKGDFKGAQQQLEEVVEMVPDNVRAHKLLLEIYKKIGSMDRYKKELRMFQMIDQSEISYSDISQIETKITEAYIETTKHKEEIETFNTKDRFEMLEDEKSLDFIEENIMEAMTKDEAIQGKENSMDDGQHKQSGFFQQSGHEIRHTSTEAFHEEGKDEIITATLAELYFSQGFLEKSIEIYKKLLIQQPDQKKWAKRLIEIQEVQNNKGKNSEILLDRVLHPEAEDKKEKLLAVLEKWLKNCQNLKKSNI